VENYVHIECEIDKKTLHKLYGLWMTIETMGEPSWGLIDKNKMLLSSAPLHVNPNIFSSSYISIGVDILPSPWQKWDMWQRTN